MKRHHLRRALVLALVLAAPAVPADTVHGPALILTDTPTDFKAIGSLTTVDDTNPVNGVGGTLLKVENAVNPANPGVPHWSFEIGHITGAPHYALNAKGRWEFVSVGVQVKGGRAANIGHIATPHAGEAPNAIPMTTSRRRNIEIGDRGRSMTAGGFVAHANHFDMYTFETRVTGVQGNANPGNAAPGPPNLLTGGFELSALHRNAAAPGGGSDSDEGSFYSDPSGGTWISYDAKSKKLTIHPGTINGLDLQGGRLGGVASEFTGDAMLGATWTVTPLELRSVSGGVAEFSGGDVEVTDPKGRFSLQGGFDAFHIADSTSFPRLQSFGVLSNWDIERASDPDCASAFLERFVRRNLFGEGMSAERWARWNGIDLAVVSKANLAHVTENFTVSVEKLPATVYLTLNLKPEGGGEPQQQQAAPEQQTQAALEPTATPEPKDESLSGRVTDFLERAFPQLKEE